MAYQGNYPTFDPPGAYQGYAPGPYPAYNQENVYHAHGGKNDLHQPLVHDHHKEKKHHKSQKKRTIPCIVFFICILIEAAGLLYCFYYNYLFEYCYWDFGFVTYHQDVDQELAFAGDHGQIKDFYQDLSCHNQTYYAECDSLCSFADQVSTALEIPFYLLLFSGLVSIVTFLLFTCSCTCKKPKMKKGGVAFLTITSYVAVVAAVSVYVYRTKLYEGLTEPVDNESVDESVDDPKGLEIEDGGKALIAMLVFMLVYRIALIALAK